MVKLNIKKRKRELEAKEEAKIVADAPRIATQKRIAYATEEREKCALEHEKRLQQADVYNVTIMIVSVESESLN